MNASGMEPYYVLAFSLCGSLIAFLIFNFQPAKIFMGDTGSLLVGVVNAILVLKFIDPGDGPESVNPIVSSPAIGFTVLMIPLLDTLRVFAIRIFKRRSPFSPDRNHIHHLLLDRVFLTVPLPFAGSHRNEYGRVWVSGKIPGMHHPDFFRYCNFLLIYSNRLLFQIAGFITMGN
jgi:UDP-N-acetylmuramyl pentapeptide phosphotransferase/UDP-N-acetylglucosamine-1-phosphate transferase